MTTSSNESQSNNEEAHRQSSTATTTIVYRGSAEAFEHGEHTFRPGQPVSVPSDVAEDLLTYPNEKFEEAKE